MVLLCFVLLCLYQLAGLALLHWYWVKFVNTLRPRQHGRHFTDDTFKRIFLNENAGIPIKISLKFVHKGPINNIPALVQIMAWRQPGDKPLSGPMVGNLLRHIYSASMSYYPVPVKWPWRIGIKSNNVKPQQNKRELKPCSYFLR